MDDTRQKILEAAEKRFSQDGYERASMDSIAEAAGLSKGALYYCFESKAELYLAVLQNGLSWMQRQIDAIIDANGSAPQMLRSIIVAYVNVILDNPGVSSLALSGDAMRLDEALAEPVRAELGKVVGRLASLISQGVQYGMLRSCDVRAVAFAVLGMLREQCLAAMRDESFARSRIVETTYLLLSGLIQRPYGA